MKDTNMKTMNFAKLQKQANLMRRTGATAIIHSGGSQTIFKCVCGATHTCATSYRQAKHVQKWRQMHENACADLFSSIVAFRDPEFVLAKIDEVLSDDTH